MHQLTIIIDQLWCYIAIIVTHAFPRGAADNAVLQCERADLDIVKQGFSPDGSSLEWKVEKLTATYK